MATSVLQIDHRGQGITVLTLDRPEKKNALSQALRDAIVDTLRSITSDDTVEAVVLTGAGGAFCAGFDLDEVMAATNPLEVFAHATTYHHVVHTFPKPLVAAVEGVAVAGGMDLALLCDLRVCASDARFGQPQVKMGVPAAYDLLASVVPAPAARDLCLTGRIIDATEANDIGLVHRLVEPGSALDAAVELATEIAQVAGASAMKEAIIASQPALFSSD